MPESSARLPGAAGAGGVSVLGAGFVGREREFRALAERLDGARAGKGGLVVLVGRPGVGKTRLARELGTYARLRGALVAPGRFRRGLWSRPYGAFADGVEACLRGADAERAGAHAAVLAELAPQLRALLSEAGRPQRLSADEERLRLSAAIAEFFARSAAEQPVVVLLDDLHWSDPASIGLLRHLVRMTSGAPVLVVATYDSGLAGAGVVDPLEALAAEAAYRRLDVGGLERRDLAELAAAHGRGEAAVDAADGSPFLLLYDVEAELRRLSPDARAVLRAAAVLPDGVEAGALAALTQLSAVRVEQALDETRRAGLLVLDEREVSFGHVLVWQTARGSLDPSELVLLHRRAAEASPPEAADRIAYHFHASRALAGAERGIPSALAAAEQAEESAALEQAVAFLRIAAELAAGGPAQQRAEVLRRLALAEAGARMLDAALGSVGEALSALAAAEAPATEQAEFLVRAVELLKESGAGEDGWLPLVEQGLSLLSGERGRAWARLELLLPPRVEGVAVPAGAVAAERWIGFEPQVIEIARASGDEADCARTLFVHPWQPREEVEAILAETRSWTDPASIARGLTFAAESYLYRYGEFRRAMELFAELHRRGVERESLPDQAKALVRLALAQFALGELAEAKQTVERAKAAVRRLGPGRLVPEHPGDTARDIYPGPSMEANFACFFDGDWPTIAAHWTHVAALPERRGVAIVEAGMAAFAHTRAGSTADALLLLKALAPTLERLEPTVWAFNGAVGRGGRAVWYLGASEFAHGFRRFALDLIEAGVGDWPTVSNEQTVACMAALLGELDEAETYFARARAKFDPDAHRPQRAIVDFDEAAALIRIGGLPEHDRALGLLERCRTEFQSLEMHGWEKRALAEAMRLNRGRSLLVSGESGR